ncbi:MAG: hypothetical protein ACYCWW_20790 [Deltaproteobacteria bacterium]
MTHKKLWALLVAATCAGCGGSSTNGLFYKAALGSPSPATGSNCPSNGSIITTLTGIDGDGTIAIYPQPGGGYLLDDGSSTGITGTFNAGTYTFVGSTVNDLKGNPEITNTTRTTIQLTPSGPGATGSVTTEVICVSTGQNGAGCSGASAGAFDCTETAASQISGVGQLTPTQTSTPAAPGPAGF